MNGEWLVPESLVATELTAEQRRRAVRTVAQNARDAADLVELLDMLGLSAEQARPQPTIEPVVEQSPEPLRRIREFAAELDELREAKAAKHVRRHRRHTVAR